MDEETLAFTIDNSTYKPTSNDLEQTGRVDCKDGMESVYGICCKYIHTPAKCESASCVQCDEENFMN